MLVVIVTVLLMHIRKNKETKKKETMTSSFKWSLHEDEEDINPGCVSSSKTCVERQSRTQGQLWQKLRWRTSPGVEYVDLYNL